MKNSGIEWIGEIPDSWDISHVKNCFYLSKTKARQKDPVVLRLARSGVHVKDVTTNEGQMAESYEDYNPVCVGDLLLNPMDLYSGANCNVSEVEGVISPAYQNLRKKIELNPKYFDYYFKIQYWTMAMFAHGKGISFDNRWTINSETILNYYLPFPSLDEQNKIVLALNNKLSQVDELIANQQGQIEKLKKYKQSVIAEAVTKGLDKSAPLKDSGIEWIGVISTNAKMYRLKNVANILDEFRQPITADLRNQNADILYDYYGASGAIDKIDGYTIDDHVMLIGEDGANLRMRNLPLMYEVNGKAWINNHAHILKPKKNILFKYLFLALESLDINPYITGSAQPKLNQENLKNIWLPVFSIEEQQQIVDYLDEKCGKIDRLIAIKQEKIEKLQEYKKSLIYEYVTGKKEVV